MKPDDRKLCERIVRQVGDSERPHETVRARLKDCRDVYDGVLKTSPGRPTNQQDSNDYESDLHPPYVWQQVETLVANVVEDQPTSRVIGLTPLTESSAEGFEKLLRQQRNEDEYDHSVVEFARNAFVDPYAVMKVSWLNELERQRSRSWETPKSEFAGQPIEVNNTDWVQVANRPTYTVISAEHFWLDPAATGMRDAACAYYQTWETRRSLKALAERGVYENVDEIPDRDDAGNEDAAGKHRKGQIEIVEIWERTDQGVWLYVLADRKVLIRSCPSPLHHNELPFIVASPTPRPFKVAGRSMCEILCDLQAALWGAMNHRQDNTKQIANQAWRVDPELEGKFVGVYPGVTVIAREGQIDSLAPNMSVIEPLIAMEQTLLQSMKDISSASDFNAGTGDPSTVDPKTATEVSLIQTAGQRRMQAMKREIAFALKVAGRQHIKLCQQLMTEPEVIRIAGGGAKVDFQIVSPEQLQGHFDYEIEDVAESINRQERRTEAMLKIQTYTLLAPGLVQQGKMVNWEALAQDVAESYGEAPDKYLTAAPPPVPLALAPGGGGAPPPPPGGSPTPSTATNGAGGAPTTPPQGMVA